MIEDELVGYVSENGGWTALSHKLRPELNQFNLSDALIVFILFVIIVSIFYLLFNYFVFPKLMELRS